MKSKSSAIAILIFSLSLLLSFSLISSCGVCGQPHTPNVPVVNNPNYPTPTIGSGNTGSGRRHCPRDALKLGICAKVLDGPVNAVVGTPPTLPCCSIIHGLLDLEAAVCLCTAIKANILGIDLNIPIVLNLLINACGKSTPSDFLCG